MSERPRWLTDAQIGYIEKTVNELMKAGLTENAALFRALDGITKDSTERTQAIPFLKAELRRRKKTVHAKPGEIPPIRPSRRSSWVPEEGAPEWERIISESEALEKQHPADAIGADEE